MVGIQLKNRILTVQYSVLGENMIAIVPALLFPDSNLDSRLSIASSSAVLVVERCVFECYIEAIATGP